MGDWVEDSGSVASMGDGVEDSGLVASMGGKGRSRRRVEDSGMIANLPTFQKLDEANDAEGGERFRHSGYVPLGRLGI